MKVYCDCGTEMRTGKEYDAKMCNVCIDSGFVYVPLKNTVRPAQAKCTICAIARKHGTVIHCSCMV